MLLICIYPFTEVIFTIYRRLIKSTNPAKADSLHLHTLIYKRYALKFVSDKKKGNSYSGLFVGLLSLPPAICSFIWHKNTTISLFLCLIFFFSFISFYFLIINFKLTISFRNLTKVK